MILNKKYFIICSLLVFLTGCSEERIVNLPLDDMSGKIVIEGNVTDASGPYFVKVTRSGKISEANSISSVSDAVVVISDNNGQTDTLKYENGMYHTVNFTTVYGGIYTLSVTVDGVTYKAVSKMPEHVAFNNLIQKSIPDGEFETRDVIPVFTDPANKENYYLFKAKINKGYSPAEITVFSDYTGNGQVNVKPLISHGFFKEDTVRVEMQCIDPAVYDYFKALPQVNLENSGVGATLTNPPSNITNGALGYFSAHTTATKSIVIQ